MAADANLAGQVYPDQSLYPSNSVPALVRRINQALQLADQISTLEAEDDAIDWFAPIFADAEAGFGGPLNAYEIVRDMIDAARPACTLKINLLRRRSAVTWEAKCSYPFKNSSSS